jgi:hypothetical protein
MEYNKIWNRIIMCKWIDTYNFITYEKVKDLEALIIADAFNYFFFLWQVLKIWTCARKWERIFPRKFHGIKTIPTTENEIRNIIHSLKAKNLSSYDGLTSKFRSLFIPVSLIICFIWCTWESYLHKVKPLFAD